MKHTILLLSLLLSLSLNIMKGEDSKIQKAQKHYEQKEYALAIESYCEMLDDPSQRENATLYYNLGNAYYRHGQLGLAILNYERALRIVPQNKAIRHNLMIANNEITNPIEYPISYLSSIKSLLFQRISTRVIIIIAFLLFALLLIGILFFLLGSRRVERQIGFYTALVSFFLFIVAQVLLYSLHQQYKNPHEAIVLEGKVAVKGSPEIGSTSLTTLYEGSKITIVDSYTDKQWVAIELPDNKLGWLERNSIATIYPSSTTK